MLDEFLNYNNFIKNKYYTWYVDILSRIILENRTYNSKIHELHHPLPKSMGGTTVIILTFREHYIIHELLTRFTNGKDKMKMCFSLHTFFHLDYHRPTIKRSVLYERHKKFFIEACKNRIPHHKTEKFLIKHKKTKDEIYGTRREIVLSTGLTQQEMYNLLVNGKLKKRFNSKGWGIYIDDIDKFSYEIPRKPIPTIMKTCKYCQKNISIGNYNRWHGKKCKYVDPEGHKERTVDVSKLRQLQLNRII